jgi:ribonuclease T2
LRLLNASFGSALLVAAGLFASIPFGSMSPSQAQDRPAGCILDRCQDKLGPSGTARPNARPAPTEAPTSRDDSADEKPTSGGGFFRRATRPAGPASVAPGNFDFYVLALSWSPSFCAGRGSARDSTQCDTGRRLGFVVHGLWPQFERGFPQDCDGERNPSRLALEAARGLYPDEGLARYEWRKHGTCTGRAPSEFFADVRRARDLVTVPPVLVAPDQPQRLAPTDIQRAFYAANPRLRPGMMAIGCAAGALQEVRVCISKDLRDFRPCPEVVRSSCRAGAIQIPPVR